MQAISIIFTVVIYGADHIFMWSKCIVLKLVSHPIAWLASDSWQFSGLNLTSAEITVAMLGLHILLKVSTRNFQIINRAYIYGKYFWWKYLRVKD